MKLTIFFSTLFLKAVFLKVFSWIFAIFNGNLAPDIFSKKFKQQVVGRKHIWHMSVQTCGNLLCSQVLGSSHLATDKPRYSPDIFFWALANRIFYFFFISLFFLVHVMNIKFIKSTYDSTRSLFSKVTLNVWYRRNQIQWSNEPKICQSIKLWTTKKLSTWHLFV